MLTVTMDIIHCQLYTTNTLMLLQQKLYNQNPELILEVDYVLAQEMITSCPYFVVFEKNTDNGNYYDYQEYNLLVGVPVTEKEVSAWARNLATISIFQTKEVFPFIEMVIE